jgi:hypothetical protein
LVLEEAAVARGFKLTKVEAGKAAAAAAMQAAGV